MRLIFVMNGKVAEARSYAGEKLFEHYPLKNIKSDEFEKVFTIVNIYRMVDGLEQKTRQHDKKFRTDEFGSGLKYGKFAITGAIFSRLEKDGDPDLAPIMQDVFAKWKDFEATVSNFPHNKDYFDEGFRFDNYYKGKTVNKDLTDYFA